MPKNAGAYVMLYKQPIKAVHNLYSKWKVIRKTQKHCVCETEFLFFC